MSEWGTRDSSDFGYDDAELIDANGIEYAMALDHDGNFHAAHHIFGYWTEIQEHDIAWPLLKMIYELRHGQS